MCWMCNHPEATPEQWLDHVRGLIADQGWMVQTVRGRGCEASLAYTVGLTELGLAELVVTGLKAHDAGHLLDDVATYVTQTSVVLPGETMQTGPWLVEALAVTAPERHLFTALELYGPVVRGLQLAWADVRGTWPWERGHRTRRGGQPLLGARVPRFCQEHDPARCP